VRERWYRVIRSVHKRKREKRANRPSLVKKGKEEKTKRNATDQLKLCLDMSSSSVFQSSSRSGESVGVSLLDLDGCGENRTIVREGQLRFSREREKEREGERTH